MYHHVLELYLYHPNFHFLNFISNQLRFSVCVRVCVCVCVRERERDRERLDLLEPKHGYIWTSVVTQLVKNPLAMKETWVLSLGWEGPLENGKVAPHSNILA